MTHYSEHMILQGSLEKKQSESTVYWGNFATILFLPFSPLSPEGKCKTGLI